MNHDHLLCAVPGCKKLVCHPPYTVEGQRICEYHKAASINRVFRTGTGGTLEGLKSE